MRFETRPEVVTYLGRKRSVDIAAWWCSGCGESVFDGPANDSLGRAYLELKDHVRGGVTLSQELAAKVEKLKGRR
jgi:YgiT-type zinc finger domain-containing protein